MRHPILIIFILYAIALTIALSRKAPHRKIDKPVSRGWGNHLRILVIGATGGTGRELVRQAFCDVPRLICESSLGIGNSVGRLGLLYTFLIVPLILPFVFWDKVRQEKLIEESDVDWVIVRPGALNNSPARGKYRHGRNLGNFLWTVRISRADVANFMLKQLMDDSYIGTAVAVCW